MATTAVCNDCDGWLVLWLEPLGEDRWLKPGESVLVRSDYHGDEIAFRTSFWINDEDRAAGIENISVWVENGDCYAKVVDDTGRLLECGYQRPKEVEAERHADLSSSYFDLKKSGRVGSA